MPTSNERSYNVLINRFKAFADGHYLIKMFSHGDEVEDSTTKNPEYPSMHVFCEGGGFAQGRASFNFNVRFADLPKTNETTPDIQKDFLSDCLRLAQDLCAEIKNGELFTYQVDIIGDPTFQFFSNDLEHTLSGVILSFTIGVPFTWNACDIPANYSPGGGNSSSGPSSGGALTLKTNGVTNPIQSLLDLVEGSGMTITDNGNGQIVFESSGGGGGLSCSDLPACPTIIAIVKSVTDEAAARTLADLNLATSITNEGSVRGAADTTLQNNIDAETNARKRDYTNNFLLMGG